MLFACKCYNVFINNNGYVQQEKDKPKEFQETGEKNIELKHGVNLYELQIKNKSNKLYTQCFEFLRQGYGPVDEININITLPDLIYKIPIEPWSLNYCINCGIITHAINLLNSTYLINFSLEINKENMISFKQNKSYSQNFGVILFNPRRPSDDDSTKDNFLSRINNTKTKNIRTKNLEQHMKDILQKEIYATNERIRHYTETQFSLLKNFREKIEQDYNTIIRIIDQVPEELKMFDEFNNKIINNDQLNNKIGTDKILELKNITNLDTPPVTPDSTPMSIGNSPTFRHTAGNIYVPPIKEQQHKSININENNLDTDCLFELEGMEESSAFPNQNTMSDLDEVVDGEDVSEDEEDIGIHFNESKKLPNNIIARSLPISIAAIGETDLRSNFDSDDEELNENNVDIAASIKALAKSVHGDTVFGDLPRPRFSTQI